MLRVPYFTRAWPFKAKFSTSQHYNSMEPAKNVLAIRREDQSVWERRAPLGPSQVKKLVKAGVKVIVQPSNRRAYPMQMYQRAGAHVQEDIREASVIMGVKQVPIDQLLPDRTYAFFAHVIKAQEANMTLLDAMLEMNIRLIDYEKMADADGKRIVAFGKYAGVAGLINILHGLGLRLLALGHHTPFMHIGPAHNYRNTENAIQAVRDCGYEIALGMMPKSIGPLTFVLTGRGNVSLGAQKIFDNLPHEFVPVSALKKVAEKGVTSKVYGCVVGEEDHLVRKTDGKFDMQEYIDHPDRYVSVFSHKIAPYASVILNGIYWDINCPRLLTIPDAKYLLQPVHTPWIPSSVGSPALPHRMLAICDVSADPGGSIEFVKECTTIDTPFCLYDANQNMDTNSFNGPGVLVCSIDNIPTQLPRESTDFFGQQLYPYVHKILQGDAKKPWNENDYCSEVSKAVITSNGKLTKDYEYINDIRQSNRTHNKVLADWASAEKRVLVVGAGHVAEPLVEYLARDPTVVITVASGVRQEADDLASKFSNCQSLHLNVVERPDLLEEQAKQNSLVVSLVPYSLHPFVLEQCIKTKTNMLTASYCTPAMREMNDAAINSGITVVNEIGLDPGIDHLLALECFNEAYQGGGKVESYISMVGGLPAPEFSDNPLRYKFSWSPRGVLLNTRSEAKYLKNNELIEIPSGGALMGKVCDFDFLPGLALEGFPNRDSTLYKSMYGLEQAHTVLRGTLRYRGYANVINGLITLGLLDDIPHPSLHPDGPEITWRQFLCTLLSQADSNVFYDNLKGILAEKLKCNSKMEAIEELGLLQDIPILKCTTPLDTLSMYLSKRLHMGSGERDLIVLRNEIIILWSDGSREERGINLICYGDSNGYSAMAKTVGYPAAMAGKMILDGEIQGKGMIFPFTRDIYKPLLSRLQLEGISARETSRFL